MLWIGPESRISGEGLVLFCSVVTVCSPLSSLNQMTVIPSGMDISVKISLTFIRVCLIENMQRAEYNFVNSINAKETRQKYELCIKDFMRFVRVNNHDSLLKIDVEKSIIDYIVDLRKKVSSATLHTRLASIYHFYTMNDVLLNKNKDFQVFHVDIYNARDNGLVTQEFINEKKIELGPLFAQTFLGSFDVGVGNVFDPLDIDKSIELGNELDSIPISQYTLKVCALDPGFGSSPSAICLSELLKD
jgi:hypothetical protein